MRKKTALRTPQQRETSVRKPGGLIDRGENAQDSATAKSALTNRSHRTRRTTVTAEVLGLSPATVKREWSVAKAWLSREMRKGSGVRGTKER